MGNPSQRETEYKPACRACSGSGILLGSGGAQCPECLGSGEGPIREERGRPNLRISDSVFICHEILVGDRSDDEIDQMIHALGGQLKEE